MCNRHMIDMCAHAHFEYLLAFWKKFWLMLLLIAEFVEELRTQCISSSKPVVSNSLVMNYECWNTILGKYVL